MIVQPSRGLRRCASRPPPKLKFSLATSTAVSLAKLARLSDPMIEVLDLHGLSSVELDPDGMHRLDHLVSGRAMFSPREGYPTLHGSVQMGERVPVTFW
jgi:hypothetical protein